MIVHAKGTTQFLTCSLGPVFRVHRKVETLEPKAYIHTCSHCKAIIGILFSQYIPCFDYNSIL